MPGGRAVHHPGEPLIPYAVAQAFDIPSDLDTASQADLWIGRRSGRAEFRRSYPGMLGEWVDAGRTRQHDSEEAWKKAGSGGFLTWNDLDREARATSRIPGGVNDVDCVVNLNVLDSLAVRRADPTDQAALPPKTAAARDAACALVRKAVEDGKGAVCSVYYDESHVLMAFARALSDGADCLEPVRGVAYARVRERAAAALTGADAVTLAELLVALRLLDPGSGDPLAGALERRLQGMIESDDDEQASLPEGFLFRGTFHPALGPAVSVTWTSRAMSTALALWALTLP
jgi:hypothetical protein